MPFIKSEYQKGRGASKKLLSESYRGYLGRLVDEDTRVREHLPNGTTWSDYIAYMVVRRAVGQVCKDAVCFTAITELRETTEGKTTEKMEVGGNAELAALIGAINRPVGGESEEE